LTDGLADLVKIIQRWLPAEVCVAEKVDRGRHDRNTCRENQTKERLLIGSIVSTTLSAAGTLISFSDDSQSADALGRAMIWIAAGADCPDRMPIIITPTGPVPMHMVTIPITRDRVAGGLGENQVGLHVREARCRARR